MKIYIHYTDGKDPVRLFNVASVHDNGVGMVEVHLQFSDIRPTHDHVARVVIEPEKEGE